MRRIGVCRVHMRGVGMLFDPQGQLLINLFEMHVPYGDALKASSRVLSSDESFAMLAILL